MALPKVTVARVEQVLKNEELNYGIDEDGDITVGFDYFGFFIHVEDNLLRLAALWRVELPDDDTIRNVTFVLNEMNKRFSMPKLLLGGAGPSVIFEIATVSAGMTDDQLHSFIVNAFRATFAAEAHLAQELPALAPNRVEEENN